MRRKLIHSTAARRRTLMKVRHKRILGRQKLFFNFIQPEA